MAAESGDRELVITRVVRAPRERVYDAFLDTGTISNWWGPRGFTTTTIEADARPGGVWRFVMHGPDGVDYPNRIVYEELTRPERLVYDHDADVPDDVGRFRVTIRFESVEGGTRVTMRLVFLTVEEFERIKRFGAIEGGRETLARLEEFLVSR